MNALMDSLLLLFSALPVFGKRALLTLLLVTLPLFGQDPYRVVVAGPGLVCNIGELIPDGAALFIPNAVWVDHAVTAAGAPGGRVFAAMISHGANVHIAEIRPDGSHSVISQTVPGYQPVSMTVDRTGKTYVLGHACHPDGSCPAGANDAILTFTAQGHAGPVHVLGTGFASPLLSGIGPMDLAADQCTLFLIQNATIRRFNVCTGTFLPDFGTALEGSRSLRVLPDGGLLVGRADVTDRYAPNGTLTRTYPVRGGAMGLVDGGATAWIASRCRHNIVELNLATGAVVTQPDENDDGALGVVPYRGWSAAVGDFHAADVPTASAAALAFLGALIAFAAFVRLR